MDKVTQFTPHSHALGSYYGRLNVGLGVLDVLPQVGAVAWFAAVFFLVALWRFKFK